MYLLAGLKRWRRGTLRFHEENARIESWLARTETLAADNYLVAVQLAKAQRLVKGYGETHERGWRMIFADAIEAGDPRLAAAVRATIARLAAAVQVADLRTLDMDRLRADSEELVALLQSAAPKLGSARWRKIGPSRSPGCSPWMPERACPSAS